MLTLPEAIVPLLVPFATLFSTPTWRKAQLLLVGAILTPGQRTVAAALRVIGRSDQDDYARYHEVLNRAVWSSREAARILLLLLIHYLDRGIGPLVFGIGETLERRRGARIRARGIYRDAVRSSRHQLVKASGLRWISLMWLGHIPWARRHWALPVLTVLAPSSRYYQQQGRRHKKLTDWARQMVMLLRHWLPHRPLVLVGDNGYAVLDLLHCCQSLREPVTLIARLRLDAALYAPAPPRQPGQNGRPALKGPRRPTLKSLLDQDEVPWTVATVAWYDGTTRIVELTSQTAVWYRSGKPAATIRWVLIRDPQGAFDPQALLCTDPSAHPAQILEWFVLRWSASGGKSPFRKCAPIWAWRPSASGPTWPSPAPHPSCWAYSPLPPWPPTSCSKSAPSPKVPPLGTIRLRRIANFRGCHRPGATPPVAGLGGFITVSRRPQRTGTSRHSLPSNGGFPRLRRLICAKPSLGMRSSMVPTRVSQSRLR